MEEQEHYEREKAEMPTVGNGPVPAWLVGLGVALVVWAAYYLAIAV
ncbi:MAG: hypothetical protein H0Z37_00010 [Firmicutes bacterium]|nr:hypothetical protein [Bacillota bacterium]